MFIAVRTGAKPLAAMVTMVRIEGQKAGKWGVNRAKNACKSCWWDFLVDLDCV